MIKEKFLSWLLLFLENNSPKLFDKYGRDKIKYGAEGLYLMLYKLLAIFLIAWIIGISISLLKFLTFYSIIRTFSFGFHAKSSFQCFILSIIFFIFPTYIAVNFNFSSTFSILICIFSFISTILFAPADTSIRPIKSIRKRLFYKLFVLITVIIFSFFIFYSSMNSNYMLMALLVNSIMINPITYKLGGQKYENYRKEVNL